MLAETIKKERNKKGLSQMEFSKILGVSQQTIGSWETGRTSPDTEMVKNIAQYFGVSTDYLLGNPVPIYHNNDKVFGNNTSIFSDAPKENRRIPIIGTVRCGPGGFAYEYIEGYEWIDSSIVGDVRAFHCKGDSMIGLGIFDGDTAIVRIQNEVENGQLAVVVINSDEGTLKRVRYHDGVIVLEAGNPDYPPQVFSGKEANTVHIVGKVLETRRKY